MNIKHESITQTCPRCQRVFRVLADEQMGVECLWCGYGREEPDA